MISIEGKLAFITGATSGIGEATAIFLANQGCRIILCGRREDKLKALEKALSEKTQVCSLTFDIRDREQVSNAITTLPEQWQSIDFLINNAGNAHGLSPIQDGHVEDWEAMIDINVKGLLYVSKCIMPVLVNKQRGHIINIGSIAGLEVYPNGNVYCATKFAVDALTQGMRLDLNRFGIKVTAIHPGLVETEFSMVRFKGDKERAAAVYQGLVPLKGEDIAEIIGFVLAQPDHVVLADITVFPTDQANSTIVNRKN